MVGPAGLTGPASSTDQREQLVQETTGPSSCEGARRGSWTLRPTEGRQDWAVHLGARASLGLVVPSGGSGEASILVLGSDGGHGDRQDDPGPTGADREETIGDCCTAALCGDVQTFNTVPQVGLLQRMVEAQNLSTGAERLQATFLLQEPERSGEGAIDWLRIRTPLCGLPSHEWQSTLLPWHHLDTGAAPLGREPWPRATCTGSLACAADPSSCSLGRSWSVAAPELGANSVPLYSRQFVGKMTSAGQRGGSGPENATGPEDNFPGAHCVWGTRPSN